MGPSLADSQRTILQAVSAGWEQALSSSDNGGSPLLPPYPMAPHLANTGYSSAKEPSLSLVAPHHRRAFSSSRGGLWDSGFGAAPGYPFSESSLTHRVPGCTRLPPPLASSLLFLPLSV